MEHLTEKPKKRQAKKDAKKANNTPASNLGKAKANQKKSTAPVSVSNDKTNTKQDDELPSGGSSTGNTKSTKQDKQDKELPSGGSSTGNTKSTKQDKKDDELPSGGSSTGNTKSTKQDKKDKDQIVREYERKLHDIDPDILYYIGEMHSYLRKVKRRKGVVSTKDVSDYYNKLKSDHEKFVSEYELAKGKIDDYKSILDPDRVEDWFKTNLSFLYTKTGVAKANKRKRERSGMQASEIIDKAKGGIIGSYKNQEIIERLIDILKNGKSEIPTEVLYSIITNTDTLKKIVDGFKGYEFDPKKYEDEHKLNESIKSDISKMWVVKHPTKKGMQVDSLLSHASFDNMYTMYGEGVTSDDIYGVYFDKTKARNIAKRIINKYDRDNSPIEPSEEIIAEARKKRKKKKKSKKKSTRRRKPTKSIIRTDYMYIPSMKDDSGSSGDMGGDAGGGE